MGGDDGAAILIGRFERDCVSAFGHYEAGVAATVPSDASDARIAPAEVERTHDRAVGVLNLNRRLVGGAILRERDRYADARTVGGDEGSL